MEVVALLFYHVDGCSGFLRNTDSYVPNFTASHISSVSTPSNHHHGTHLNMSTECSLCPLGS